MIRLTVVARPFTGVWRALAAAAVACTLLFSYSVRTARVSAEAADPGLDPTFGEGGKLHTGFGADAVAQAVAVAPGGKILAAGEVRARVGDPDLLDLGVARYNADGSPDGSFGSGGKVQTSFADRHCRPTDMAVQADGKAVIVGAFDNLGHPGAKQFEMLRLNADGSLDTGFGTGGRVVTDILGGIDFATGVVVQPDGKILVAGGANNGGLDTPYDFAVVRYNPDGSLDAGFGSGGKATADFGASDVASDIALAPDGRIVVAGDRLAANNIPVPATLNFAVARFNAGGSPDATFDGDGKVVTAFFDQERASHVAVQPDGKIIAAGMTRDSRIDRPRPAFNDLAVARYNLDGSLDATFGNGGRSVLAFGQVGFDGDLLVGVALRHDGRIVAAVRAFGVDKHYGLARFNVDGSPDLTFGPGGKRTAGLFAPFDTPFAMALQPDGKAVVAGTAWPTPGTPRGFGLVRFDAADFVTPPSSARLGASAFSVTEGCTAASVTVTRTGDLSAPATVDYRARDIDAGHGFDYSRAEGTLDFAPGEESKTFQVLISEDSRVEGAETVAVELTGATANLNLRSPHYAYLTINDNDAAQAAGNPIDSAAVFVCQHYHDFLQREPDPSGLQFWTDAINVCGPDPQCVEERRVNVSSAFFLSIEFLNTSYYVTRLHKAGLGDSAGNPRYATFLRDTARVGRGVVIGTPGAAERLEANKREFASEFGVRPEFLAAHAAQGAEQYVDSLFANAGASPTAAERAAAVASFGAGGDAGRAAALREVAESASVFNKLYNRSVVLMEYFGYLRRDPDASPDFDFDGYDWWVAKLDGFGAAGEDMRVEAVAFGRLRRAEMVKAFINSDEYRRRFTP